MLFNIRLSDRQLDLLVFRSGSMEELVLVKHGQLAELNYGARESVEDDWLHVKELASLEHVLLRQVDFLDAAVDQVLGVVQSLAVYGFARQARLLCKGFILC